MQFIAYEVVKHLCPRRVQCCLDRRIGSLFLVVVGLELLRGQLVLYACRSNSCQRLVQLSPLLPLWCSSKGNHARKIKSVHRGLVIVRGRVGRRLGRKVQVGCHGGACSLRCRTQTSPAQSPRHHAVLFGGVFHDLARRIVLQEGFQNRIKRIAVATATALPLPLLMPNVADSARPCWLLDRPC